MSREGFLASFPQESRHVEFKTSVGAKAIQRTVTAFSNADGGVLLIGVDDDGAVVGRALTSGVESDLTQAIQTLHDPGRYWLNELDVDGRPVTVVSVAKREQGFAQTAEGQVIIRRGASSVPLLGSELLQFVTSQGLIRFETTDSRVALSEASADLIEEVRAAFNWRADGNLEERLRNEGLITSGAHPSLTVAGALALLEDPAEHLGKTTIEVLRFPDEGVDYDRRVTFNGPVQRLVSEATEFLMGELGTDLVVRGARRMELAKIPDVAVREAVANAVAHRSYEELGRTVRIELRPDRLIVESPGGLPEPVTEENIRETQSARNIRVIKILRRLRLAEDSGRGVDVMIDSMAAALLDPPQFHDDGHSVRVVLPIRGAITPQERAWIAEVEKTGRIEPRHRLVLVHAARGERLTNERVRELLAVDSRDARQVLKRLRDEGFLLQHGERGGSYYELSPSVSAPPAFRLSSSALRTLVVSMADDQPITNAAVREATGLDRAEALRLLDGLVKEGRLVRRGEKRGAHYVLATGGTNHPSQPNPPAT